MNEDDLQNIVNAVLSAIKTNSLTINQLTLVESLPDDCYFEISGGKKISSSGIKKIVTDYVDSEIQTILINIADLYKKVSEYNVSALYPTKGINGSDKYTLNLAVSVLDNFLLDNYKRDWVRILFKGENNKTIGYIYQGGGFEDISNWKPIITQETGNSKISSISQDAVTRLLVAIRADIGSESTSESEDGTVWGKLISIIQDVDSNSSSISNLETILSKSSLFKNLGIITGLSDLDTVDTPGYYTYSKSLNEDEAINGILVVSKVSYPGSFSFLQIRHELGKTYQREYDLDERVWSEWEMAGESKSIFNQVSYGDIDTVKTYGIYEVSDSDSLTRDIMFVTYSSEHGVTKQTYINTNPDFPIPELAFRVHDGEKWSEWQDIQEAFFKSELGVGTDCGLTQKYLSEILGSKTTSESEDGSIWGKLMSISDDGSVMSHDLSTLQTDNRCHATARFDGIVTDASIVIEGFTDLNGGEVLFVASKQKFAYFLNNKYYSQWPGFYDYQGSGKVHIDKVYLCANKAYIYNEGALLPTDEEALGLAITADEKARSALIKIEETNTVSNIMIDRLDELVDPLSTTSSYTVYFLTRPIGILRLITNAQSDIVTQLFDVNCDIDVAGNLLPDYNVTEPRSLVRTYNISSADISGEIPIGSWGRWKYNQKVITLSGGVIIE